MTNVSDLAIVGIIATVGILAVVASFDRRRRRRRIRRRSSVSRSSTKSIQAISQPELVIQEKDYTAVIFYNLLAAYSSVACMKTSEKRSRSEPVYSTWAKHAATGEDQIIIEGPMPYLISSESQTSAPLSTSPEGTPVNINISSKSEYILRINQELNQLRKRVFFRPVEESVRKNV